jgi:hypothetical protein
LSKCSATKPNGTPCERIVGASKEYCFAHDPAKTEARTRAARKGGKRAGRSRPMADLASLKAQLQDLYESVCAKTISTAVGAVLTQVTNAQIRITEVELKVREQHELEARLEDLERLLGTRDEDEAKPWG